MASKNVSIETNMNENAIEAFMYPTIQDSIKNIFIE